MRLHNKGCRVYPADSSWPCGFVVADADDRQGFFWMHRGADLSLSFGGTPVPKRNDVCVPLAAVVAVNRIISFRTDVHLSITRAEIEELPERWQMQPSVQEMMQALPFAGGSGYYPAVGTGSFPMIPQLPASVPAQVIDLSMADSTPPMPVPSFADAQALGDTVVSAFSQKAELIRQIARVQAMTESEEIPEPLKQKLAEEAQAAYQRLQTITEQTDMQMSAYLSQSRR